VSAAFAAAVEAERDKYRAEGAARERAAIVVWLRVSCAEDPVTRVAEAIEAGEHVPKE
jgi:hypothetical protein